MKNNDDDLRNVAYFQIDELAVGSYYPLPYQQGKPSEVHVRIKMRYLNEPLTMRFKSRKSVDEFIASLEKERDLVWPSEAS